MPDIHNTKNFAKSALSEVVVHQLATVTSHDALNISMGLLSPSPSNDAFSMLVSNAFNLPAGEPVQMSSRARLRSKQICCAKDVVLIRSQDSVNFCVGQVVIWGEAQDMTFASVNLWDLESHDSRLAAAVYRPSDSKAFVHLLEVIAVVIFSTLPDGSVRVLIPYEYQGFRAFAE